MMKTLYYVLLSIISFVEFIQGYHYVVTTYTGDRFGAGTDARVFIKLFGSQGETKEKELEASGRDNFERGQLDTFVLDTKNVGTIKKAKIRHDNSWLGPGWFLEKVTVTDENGDYYDFPVHQWLDKHQDDGKTSREISPQLVQKKQKKDEIEAIGDQRQPLDCSWAQGIGNGDLEDDDISASTSFNDLHLPYHSRLGMVVPSSLGGWCPFRDDQQQFLQFNLGQLKKITGVATQGMGLVDEWTTSYRLLYSNKSDSNFQDYSENENFPKHFLGNDDQNGTVIHWLKFPFYSRYVRINPFKWHGKGCLRVELYGCPVKTSKRGKDSVYTQVPEKHQTSESPQTDANNRVTTADLSKGELGEDKETKEDTGEKYENIPKRGVTSMKKSNENQFELPETEKKADQINEIDAIPIVHLDFDEIKEKTIPDVSGHHNDAHLRLPVDVRMLSRSCERGVRMNGGDIYFDGEFFIDKPRSEVTIAAWIKLFSNGGLHSIFDTIGAKRASRGAGQYHFEVDRGCLRWYHINEVEELLFNVSSPLMIPAHTWTHCAASYSSATGKASVFINAKLVASGIGIGMLTQDWKTRAGIGQHKGKRVLNGEIDEFYIYNKALPIKKIQLLMKKCSFETDCQRALGMQSKEISDAQIKASSIYNLHKPYYGRMNLASFGGDPARTAWCAVKDDRSPYFEIELPEMTSLTGVATQGLSLFDNWVTSYLFCYSKNREVWICYKEKGYDKVFEANTDKNSIKRHHFHHAVDAKFVRIRPQSWYGNHLCMRVEIYGCTMDLIPDIFDSFGSLPVFMEDTEAQTRNEISPKESCNKPLGITNGEVDDIHLTASSSLNPSSNPFNGRLVRESIEQADIKGCWCARDVNLRQYIEADLGEVKTITGIATQGYVSHDNWVASYRLGFSDDSNALEWYRENDDERLFDGNTDRSSIVKHYLKHPIQARYVRLNPRAWHGIHICTRFEIFGCKEALELATARIVLDDDTQEFTKVPAHHTIKDLPYHNILSDSPLKSPIEEENPDNKHFIPKIESMHSSYHLLAGKLNEQVNGKMRKTHEVKRLKPGHGSREMLDITYPRPHITMPHQVTNQSHRMLKSNNNKKLKYSKPLEPIEKDYQSQVTGNSKKEGEFEMLKIVDKLQNLSDDKLANEMKGPILALAKEKILEDLTNIKSLKMSSEDCKRSGTCTFQSSELPALPLKMQQFPAQKNNNHLEKLQQNFFSEEHQPAQNFVDQFPTYFKNEMPLNNYYFTSGITYPTPKVTFPTETFINAPEILNKYPELKSNGVTESTLNLLASHVPNLVERINRHFATKYRAMEERNHKINEENNRLFSSPDFMKNFKEYLQGSLDNDISKNMLQPTSRSYYIKPLSIDEYPCKRDGSCFFPNSLFHKPPHALPPKPDVWIKDAFLVPSGVKDDTRLTPDHMISQGPDPRFLDYYRTYLEGHPGIYLQPTLPPPTHPFYPSSQPTKFIPPSPQPEKSSQGAAYLELSTSLEGVQPGSVVTSEFHVTTMEWTPFSVCSVTCGRGEKKRFRRCSQRDCPSGGVEIETVICTMMDCPEIDPYNWSPFSACSATCGKGLSSRYRLCKEAGCAGEGYETEQITCILAACPVCLLDFEVIENHIVIDQSGWGNHGYLDQHVTIHEHPQICGHYADLTNMGEVLFSAQTFLGKPRTGISIACWVNIQGDINHKHSIFSTIRKTQDNEYIGGYHLEIDSGSVRWFHRDEHSRTIYSMVTNNVIMRGVWVHMTVMYDAYKGYAKVYVDGIEQGNVGGSGMLAEDWGYKASIGSYDFDNRRLDGWVDEFIIYDYALEEEEVFHLLGKMRCPTGKSTTIEIDAFKFETMNINKVKRGLTDENTNSSKKIDTFTSRINSKHKRFANETKTGKSKKSAIRNSRQTRGIFDRMLTMIDTIFISRDRNKSQSK